MSRYIAAWTIHKEEKKEGRLMTLKESYRYMNFLNSMLEKANGYLMQKNFCTTTKQSHNRTKGNPSAVDEEIIAPKDFNIDFDANTLVDFCVKILDEKQRLSTAITTAKKTTEIDIDHSVSMNKWRETEISMLRCMDSIKNSEKETYGTDYMINSVEGNQVSYRYPIKEVVTIDFDRNSVKGLIKKLSKEHDEISTKLDKIQIETVLDFEPKYDVNDSFEDVVLV